MCSKEREIFILNVCLGNKKYYVTDLEGSLSRSIQDSMLIFNEKVAESYSGTIEHLVEEKTKGIATISIMQMPLSSAIPKTIFECIPCP